MKSKALVVLKISLVLFLIWYLFHSGSLSAQSFAKMAQPASVWYLVIACIAFYFSQMLASMRLLFMLRIIDVKLTLPYVFKLTMIGNFFNFVIPGAVGGDAVKGYYLQKIESGQRGRSAGILIVDRIVGLIALVVIGSLCLAYLFKTSSFVFKTHQSALSIFAIAASVFFCLFIFFVFVGNKKTVREKVKALALRLFREGFIYFIIEGLGSVVKKRSYVLVCLLISLFMQVICLVGVISLVGVSGGDNKSALTLMAISSVVMLFSVVPVSPGNIGWTELMANYGWAAVGGQGGAEVFLFWRIVTILCSLPGAVFYAREKAG